MKTKQLKTRTTAMAIHGLISLCIFACTAFVLIYFYFPKINFQINGGIQGLWMMFFIDLILGPLITFLVYNPDKEKKEKRNDLCIIAGIQLSALIYGAYHIYLQHPICFILNSGAVIQSISYNIAGENIKNVELSNYQKLEGLPFIAFDPEELKNSGFVPPEHNFKDVIRLQNELEKELGEEFLPILEQAKKRYTQPTYLLRIVGSYQTDWFLTDENLQYLESIKRTPTI